MVHAFPAEVTSVPFFGESGEMLTSMTIRDITERMRLQEELRCEVEKYRVLFESFPLGIAMTNGSGTIVESNRVAEQLLGLAHDKNVGRAIDGPDLHIVRLDGTPMPSAESGGVCAPYRSNV